MAYVLYGLVNTEYYSKNDNSRILTSYTYTNGGIEISANDIDIKGGLGNKLLARLYSDAMLTITATDALFDYSYIRMITGQMPTVGGTRICEPERVVTTVNNQITVTGTPVAWNGELCGWYSVTNADGSTSGTWNKCTFVGQTATVSNLPIGSSVCVQYNVQDNTLRVITVPATLIPEEVYIIMKAGLFYADATGKPTSKAGDIIIEVPRFRFSPSTTFSFDNAGASTTDLSGNAMAFTDGTTSCDTGGSYARIKEYIPNRGMFENLTGLAISSGADIQLATGEDTMLQIYGVRTDGGGIIPNSELTFTSTTAGTASVDNTGKVTGVAQGSTTIKVVATGTSIEAIANVTVS